MKSTRNKTQTCKYIYTGELEDDSRCKHPVYDNEGYCIFHSKDVDAKSDDFLKELNILIEIFEKDKDCHYNFLGFIFPKISFIGKTFAGEANFGGCHFADKANFGDCHFADKANFNDCQFSSHTYFGLCQFTGDANFAACQFSGNAYFVLSYFYKHLNLQHTIVDGKLNFLGTFFYHKVDIIYANVNNEINFKDIKVLEKPDGEVLMNFKHNTFKGKIRFIDSDLSKCSFLYSEIRCFDFVNTNWAKDKKGRNILYDEILLSKNEYDVDKIKILEELYRQLKVKFSSLKDFQQADAFFYNELKIKQQQQKSILTWEWLYKWTSDYGMSWKRPLFLVIVVFAIFTIMTACITEIGGVKESIVTNLKDTLLVKLSDNEITKLGDFIIAFKIKTIFITSFIIQAGFAVRRRFRT